MSFRCDDCDRRARAIDPGPDDLNHLCPAHRKAVEMALGEMELARLGRERTRNRYVIRRPLNPDDEEIL